VRQSEFFRIAFILKYMIEQNQNSAEQEGGVDIREKEKKLQERLDFIYEKNEAEAAQSEKAKSEMSLDDYVEKLTAHLPSKLKEKIQNKIDRLKKRGLSEEELKNETEAEAGELYDAYLDDFGMPNKNFEKMVMKDMIGWLLKNKPTVADLKKLFYISWDLNGLRAANNLNGGKHEQGDRYIKIPVRALKDPSVTALAKKFGLDATMVHESGDEFGCLGMSQDPIETDSDGKKSKGAEGVSELMTVIHDKIVRDEDARNVIDVSDPAVQENLTKPMREAIAECERNGVKPTFRAWMSGDVCTFYEALMGDISEKNKINEGDDIEKIKDKLMGAWLDGGNLKQKKKKGGDKKGLAASKDLNDRFIASIQNMGEETADTLQELDEEKKITSALIELGSLKDKRNELKSRLLSIYESGDLTTNEREISDNRLATRVKDEEIRELEEKIKRLRE
jgi:hypothetical protein